MRRTQRSARRTGLLVSAGLVVGMMVGPAASPAAAAELGGDIRLSDMGPESTPGFPALRSRVAFGASRYLTVWEGGDTLGTKAQIHGQLVDAATGAEVAPNDFLVGTIGTAVDDTTDAVEPDVVYNSTRGEFLVVYAADDTVDAVDTFEIYAQRVSTAGSMLGSPVRVSDMGLVDTSGNFDARTPAVAYDDITDQYLVVWSGDDDTTPLVNNELEIYGQRLGHDAGGALVEAGADVRLSDMGPDGNGAFDAREPAVAWNPASGEYLVAWSGTDVNANALPWQIFGQRVSPSGTEMGTDVLLGTSGDEGYTPAVTTNPTSNQFLVVWMGDDGTANTFDIYGQLVDGTTGAEIGTDARISNVGAPSYGARTPAATWDAFLGEYEVVWAGDAAPPLGTGDEDYEVFLARLTPSLTTAAPTTRVSAIGGVTTSTQTPDIAFSGAALTTSLVVWAAENQGVTVPGEAEVWGQLLAPQVDLAITKTRLSAANPGPGDPVQFRIVVANNGSEPASGIRVSDTVAAAIADVQVTLPQGATSVGAPPAYVWAIPTLLPGGQAEIALQGVVASSVADGLVVLNTATVTQTVPHVDSNLANNSATASFAVDRPPSVTVEQAGAQADPANASPVTFTATFSEPVTGFTGNDVQLGGTAGATTATISGSGPAYTIEVSGMTADGTVTASIPANRVTDSASKANLASTSADNAVTYDATAPTVTVEQAAGQADPAGTQPIAFTATFSEPVVPLTAAGVDLSGTAGVAGASVTVTGGPTVYSISVSGISAEGTVRADVPGAATTDLAGNANSASTSLDSTVTYDTTKPSVSLSTSASNPTATSPIPVTATFSEDVVGFTKDDVVAGNATVGVFTGGPRVYTFDLVPAGDGLVTADVAADVATDATGNGNAEAAQLAVRFDTTRPTVELSTSASSPTATSPIPVTATFSEDVAGFTMDDVVAGNATVGGLAGGPRIYTFTLTPAGDGTVTADVAEKVATDAADNGNTAAARLTVDYDGTSPTVLLSTSVASATSTTPIPVTATFSEDVSGFTEADVVVGNATLVGFAGGPRVWTFDLVPAADGVVTADVADDAAQDAAGRGNAAATQLAVRFDTMRPSVALSTTAASPTDASPIPVTATFSEDVAGFTEADVVVGNATLAGFAGGPRVWTFDLVPAADGVVTADVAADVASDAAGNGNARADQVSVLFDRTGPIPTLRTDPNPTNRSPVPVTIQFDDTVTGFTIDDLVLGGGTAGGFVAVDGDTFTVDVTPQRDGVVSVEVRAGAAQDARGRDSSGGRLDITFDTERPSVALSTSAASPTALSPIPVTVTFSEDVAGFTADDVVVGNATVSSLGGGPRVWTLAVAPAGDGPVSVDVPPGGAVDAAANASTTAARLVVASDRTRPTVSLSTSAASPTGASPIPVTATFSEDVTGFTADDVVVANAVRGDFAGGPRVYTFTLTPIGNGTVTADVAEQGATDAAGNGNTKAAQLAVRYARPAAVPPVTCMVKAVSNGSKLKVTVGPSLPGNANYTFRLDVRRDGAWYRYLKQYRTKGTAETRTVNVPKGTYRAKCYGPGFPQVTGTEAGDTVSRTVKVRR